MSDWLIGELREYSAWADALWREALVGSPIELQASETLANTPIHPIECAADSLAGMRRRGALRELAESASWKDFLDTDFVGFAHGRPTIVDGPLRPTVLQLMEADLSAWRSVDLADARVSRWAEHHSGCPFGWGQAVARGLKHPWPAVEPKDPLSRLETAYGAWRELLEANPLDAVYVWRRPKHGDRTWSVAQIAVHCALHGAYHFGQLGL